MSKDILTSAGKLKAIYNAISNNINTDLSLREMIALGGFAKQMDHSHLVRKVIHDDPGQEGGFLYTPERELYNGQFVLIPFGNNYELLHKYTDLIFNRREIYYQPATIEILNATKWSGIARNSAYQLIRFGFDVEKIDNYYNADGEKAYLDESIIKFYDYTEDAHGLIQPKYQETLNVLDSFVKAKEKADRSAYLISEDGDKKIYEGSVINLSIILGADYDVFLVN